MDARRAVAEALRPRRKIEVRGALGELGGRALADGGDRQRGVDAEARRDRRGVHAEEENKLGLDPDFKVRKTKVAEAPERGGRRLFVAYRKRVKWLGMVNPKALKSEAAIRRGLRKAR